MFKAFRAQSPRRTEDVVTAPAESDEDSQEPRSEDYHAGQTVDPDDHGDPDPTFSSLRKSVDLADGRHLARTFLEFKKEPPLPTDAPTVARQRDIARRYAAGAFPAGRRDQSHSHDEIDNTLTVGRNIHLEGKVGSCETLVVQGKIEATAESRVLRIAEAGVYNGEIEVETAEISGRFDGKLLARKRLIIHSSGRVSGSIRYGGLRIDEGGEISGDIRVVNYTEEVADQSSLDDTDRSTAQPPESVEPTSQESSDFLDPAHIDASLPIVGQDTQTLVPEDPEGDKARTDEGATTDPGKFDRRVNITRASPSLS